MMWAVHAPYPPAVLIMEMAAANITRACAEARADIAPEVIEICFAILCHRGGARKGREMIPGRDFEQVLHIAMQPSRS